MKKSTRNKLISKKTCNSARHIGFVSNDIISKNYFKKYIKGKKADKYNKDLVTFVKDHYETSKREAEGMIDILILTNKGLQSLVDAMKVYGKTEKEIKKLLK